MNDISPPVTPLVAALLQLGQSGGGDNNHYDTTTAGAAAAVNTIAARRFAPT